MEEKVRKLIDFLENCIISEENDNTDKAHNIAIKFCIEAIKSYLLT